MTHAGVQPDRLPIRAERWILGPPWYGRKDPLLEDLEPCWHFSCKPNDEITLLEDNTTTSLPGKLNAKEVTINRMKKTIQELTNKIMDLQARITKLKKSTQNCSNIRHVFDSSTDDSD